MTVLRAVWKHANTQAFFFGGFVGTLFGVPAVYIIVHWILKGTIYVCK